MWATRRRPARAAAASLAVIALALATDAADAADVQLGDGGTLSSQQHQCGDAPTIYAFGSGADAPATALATFTVSQESGDLDIYMTDDGSVPSESNYQWRQNHIYGGRAERLTVLAGTGAALRAAVVCGSTASASTRITYDVSYDLDTEARPALGEAATASSMEPGRMKMFTIDVPGGANEVELYVTSTARSAGSSSRNRLLVRFGPVAQMVMPYPRKAPDGTESLASAVLARRGGSVALTRGSSNSNTTYLTGPETMYVTVVNYDSYAYDLQPRRAGEDATASFELTAYVRTANFTCAGSSRFDSGERELFDGRYHFFAVPFNSTNTLLHAEVTSSSGEAAAYASRSQKLPMSAAEGFFAEQNCGNGAVDCIITSGGAATQADVDIVTTMDTVITDYAKAMSECNVPEGGNALDYVYFGVRSQAGPGRYASFSLKVWDLAKPCGWRPTCQSCAAAGDACTWCTSGGSYCDSSSVVNLPADAPGGSCQQAAWCPSDGCSQITALDECVATTGCGWCGHPLYAGACATGSEAGPESGLCEAWVHGPDADLDDACAVHDGAQVSDKCATCLLDRRNCGFGYDADGTSACVAGNATMSLSGAFPRGQTAGWAFDDDTVCDDLSSAADAQPVALGSSYTVPLDSTPGVTNCLLGVCDEATFSVSVPASTGVGTVRASVSVQASDGAVSLSRFENGVDGGIVGVEHGSLAKQVFSSVCGSEEAVFFYRTSLSKQKTTATAIFSAAFTEGTITLDSSNGYATELTSQAMCCNDMRLYTVEVSGAGTAGEVKVAVSWASGSGDGTDAPHVYARLGACPTLGLYDQRSTSDGNVTLAAAAGGERWYLGVLGASDGSYREVSLSVAFAAGGSDDGDLDPLYIGLIAGLGGLLVVTAAYVVYWRRQQAMKDKSAFSQALTLSSAALAAGLDDLEAPLALEAGAPRSDAREHWSKLQMSVFGSSDAEVALITLVKQLKSRLDSLEVENRSLREHMASPRSQPLQAKTSPSGWDRAAEGLDRRGERGADVEAATGITPASAGTRVASAVLQASARGASNTRRSIAAETELVPQQTDAAAEGEESGEAWVLQLECPDGSVHAALNGEQVLGRGFGGVWSKKVSREQALLRTNLSTGAFELLSLGKNPCAIRAQGGSWHKLLRGVASPLANGDEFTLLAPDSGEDDTVLCFKAVVQPLP